MQTLCTMNARLSHMSNLISKIDERLSRIEAATVFRMTDGERMMDEGFRQMTTKEEFESVLLKVKETSYRNKLVSFLIIRLIYRASEHINPDPTCFLFCFVYRFPFFVA
jgi:hypothetical protein